MKTRPFVSTEYTNVTDGRTDTARRYRPRLCIALRGKKTTSRGDRSVWSVAYSFVELSSVKYKAVVCSIDDAALAGDRPSSVDVVSRHHAHRYTRPLTLAYSFRYLHAHTHTSSLSASSSSSSSYHRRRRRRRRTNCSVLCPSKRTITNQICSTCPQLLPLSEYFYNKILR